MSSQILVMYIKVDHVGVCNMTIEIFKPYNNGSASGKDEQ